MKLLLVFCHPDVDSYGAALRDTAVQALQAAGHEVRQIDLYAEGFNPVFSAAEKSTYLSHTASNIAGVAAHVNALRWADGWVAIYPTWFYGPPAMLKGWLERVWLPRVAFLPPAQKSKAAVPGLRHIQRLTIITHGGAPWWWLRVVGDPARKLSSCVLRALVAKNYKTTWLQLHNMNHMTRADCDGFLAKVTTTLKAI